MKVPVYNLKGEILKEIDLNDSVFNRELNNAFVHQIYVNYLSNRRQPLAFTKDRSEVRGGGKKPWPQKGTGRARHASIRSPLWKGGSVVFGPRHKERNFKKKINRKERKIALSQVISQKIRDKEVFILEDLKIKEPKTKEIIKILENLKLVKAKERKPIKKTIILIDPKQEEIKKASKNIPFIKVMTVNSLDLVELLNNKYLIFSKELIPVLEKNLSIK